MTWQHEQIKCENIDVEVMIGEIYVQEKILRPCLFFMAKLLPCTFSLFFGKWI
jgi:methyl coenzyme M reductase subunit D